MAKYTYLTKFGTIQTLTMEEVASINNITKRYYFPSWESMHNIKVDYVSKEESEFLKRYGLKTTIFNVGNLRKYGAVQIYPNDVKIALEHGAKDMRL